MPSSAAQRAVVLVLAVAVGVSLGLALLIVGVLAAFILWSIASDVFAPTPTVTPYDPAEGPRKTSVIDDEPDLSSVLDGTGEVDALGKGDETVVRITKVLGPDGWYYTVTLPSTQE